MQLMDLVVEIIVDEKLITDLDKELAKFQNGSGKFFRWKKVLLEFIRQSKENKKYFNKNNFSSIATRFESFFTTNAILTQYINDGEINFIYVEKQISNFYTDILKELGIIEENKVSENVQEIFGDSNSSEKGRSLVLSNGHSTLPNENISRGYVDTILMGLLTASIAVSTVAYILFNAM